MSPVEWAQHGDLCVAGGIDAQCLLTRGSNHDPQHIPYGIWWFDQTTNTGSPLNHAVMQKTISDAAQQRLRGKDRENDAGRNSMIDSNFWYKCAT